MGIERLLPRPAIADILPYQPGKPVAEVERELGIARAIKLASNENPFGPSPRVRAALRQAAGSVNIYPDGACYYLRHALARNYKYHPEEIIVGNGSNELLVLLGLAYLNPGDEVLTSQMSFVVYRMVARLMQAKLTAIPMRDYTFDLEAMTRALTSRTKIVFIANPNNPTGTLLDARILRRFIDRVPPGCLVVLDEAYYEYVDPRLRSKSLDWVRERRNLVVLRTFSKAYALAGLRVGYGMVSPEVKQAIERVRDPFNVNSLAQIAALAALEDRAYMQQCVQLVKTERERIGKELAELGLKVIPSQTNFIFTQLPRGESQAVAHALMRRGIIIRPFPGPYIRITLGRVVENNKMIQAMKKVIGELGLQP